VVDDLSAPLGQYGKRPRRFALPKAVPNAIAGVLAAIVLGFALWTLVVEDPLGGEPVVIVSTQAQPPSKTGGKPEGTARGPNDPAVGDVVGSVGTPAAGSAQSGTQTVTIIDGISGKREQVTIPTGTGGGPKSGLPEGRKNSPAASAPTKAAVLDARLADNSRHGTIPKIAADGARALEVFARAPDKTSAGGGPRVAIVVGKLGITANATSEALAKLPAPVTLAFSPYGADLERWVARARGEGREVLLQVPMEPHDYPANDPGPQTLLTSLPAEQNIDRLHWFMSRFQGYAGIASDVGARFVTNEQAVAAVVREVGKRGLLYFDDGAATRSVATQVAGASNVPFARADVVLDAVPTPADIDGALAKLEALARERGVAVGAAGALPVSIERIARWAKAAAGRGIALVPVSAVAKTTEVRDQRSEVKGR
jgi:polysaccharide deacetylase 2 family uncharacterized protein YibQ